MKDWARVFFSVLTFDKKIFSDRNPIFKYDPNVFHVILNRYHFILALKKILPCAFVRVIYSK